MRKLGQYILYGLVFLIAIAFVVKFGSPQLLKAYIEGGIGNCQKIPILCKIPEDKIIIFEVDKVYASGLLPYKFPGLEISLPKGFKVVKELIKRPYYKKKKFVSAEPVIYLLCQKPAFFANLFPQSKATGADTNYKFIKATMFANLSRIKNLNETFFIILKSIFIPDIGNQNTARMIQFKVADKVGFINYNLTPSENYFDCDVFNEKGDFFKVYIKDISSTLDLSKVGTIISTASAL